VPKELNLDDMLFRYGVRINNNLIMDLTAAKIPVVTDYLGKQRYFSWYFFPLLVPKSRNPIVHNVNTLKSEFISSIDTVSAKDIRKTPLTVHFKIQQDFKNTLSCQSEHPATST